MHRACRKHNSDRSTRMYYIDFMTYTNYQPGAKERVKELADMIFRLIDGNNDGVISYNKFCEFYKAMNANQELIDTLFKQADTNKDRVINHLESQEINAKYFFST